MANFVKLDLAPTGSTGNNTHSSVALNDISPQATVQFVVEAIGATPTVTYKVQGSYDGVNFFDAFYAPASSDTSVNTAITVTTVGISVIYLVRPYKFVRLVTSANTNVTYRGEIYMSDGVTIK